MQGDKTRKSFLFSAIGALLLCQLFASTATAQFSEFSVELGEGETITVSLVIPADNIAQLVIEPLYAFTGYENALIFEPKAVSGKENILIHFAHLSKDEKASVSPDIYRVNLVAYLDNDDVYSSLLIYLNLENLVPEEGDDEDNVSENIIALWEEFLALRSDVDTLKAGDQHLRTIIDNIISEQGLAKLDRDDIKFSIQANITLTENIVAILEERLPPEEEHSSDGSTWGLFAVTGVGLVILIISLGLIFKYKLKGAPQPTIKPAVLTKEKQDEMLRKLKENGKFEEAVPGSPIPAPVLTPPPPTKISQLCPTCQAKVVNGKVKLSDLCDKCREVVKKWR